MARSIRSAALETRAARLRLPVAIKPTFVRVAKGLGLGYRRNKSGGVWVMRVADGKRSSWVRTIGAADDFADADGNDVLTFWQAQDKVRSLARADRGGTAEPVTVAQALAAYEADLKIRGGDAGNVTRIRAHMTNGLASKLLTLLTPRELRAFRDELIERMSPASVNRTCVALKAALNLAAQQDERIISRSAWKIGLATIPDAHVSRNVILDEQAIRAVIAMSYEQSDEFGLLVETGAVTGARVSQLARLEVQDLQDDRPDPRLMMPGSRKGRGEKKITRRPVPIPASLAVKLRNGTEGREPSAPLLVRESGERWHKIDHARPFARAVRAAALDPREVTIYALRHSSIVRQLLAGVPVRVVAVNHDTSVAMIERTYSRYIGDHADALARKALLDIGSAPSGSDPDHGGKVTRHRARDRASHRLDTKG
jgi:integrase